MNSCCQTCWTKNYPGCLNSTCRCHSELKAQLVPHEGSCSAPPEPRSRQMRPFAAAGPGYFGDYDTRIEAEEVVAANGNGEVYVAAAIAKLDADDLVAAREIVAELLITQQEGHRSGHAMASGCLCRYCRAHRFVAGQRPRSLLDGGVPRLDALREIIHRNDVAAIPPLKRVTLGDIQQVESLKRKADADLCGMCGMAACGCVPDL